MNEIETNIKIIQLSLKQLDLVIECFEGYDNVPKNTDFYRTKLAEYQNALNNKEYELKKLSEYQNKHPELFI